MSEISFIIDKPPACELCGDRAWGVLGDYALCSACYDKVMKVNGLTNAGYDKCVAVLKENPDADQAIQTIYNTSDKPAKMVKCRTCGVETKADEYWKDHTPMAGDVYFCSNECYGWFRQQREIAEAVQNKMHRKVVEDTRQQFIKIRELLDQLPAGDEFKPMSEFYKKFAGEIRTLEQITTEEYSGVSRF